MVDAKQGKLFAKLVKNVSRVAARTGGGDPAGNPTLFDAIQKAKKILGAEREYRPRGQRSAAPTRAQAALVYENITYEGYGPGGVAVLVECLTDNRNRAASSVKVAFAWQPGTPGRPGLGVVPVQPQGRHRRREGRRHPRPRTTCCCAVLDAVAEEVNDLTASRFERSSPSRPTS